ncbi:MAG: hypothetical protein ACE5HR_04105 [bacterium]
MKNKRLLVIILLSLSFCFVSGAGYGEVLLRNEMRISSIDFFLLEDRIDYIMFNPTVPLIVDFHYDPDGRYGRSILLSEDVDTTGKIYVWIQDKKGVFSDKNKKPY